MFGKFTYLDYTLIITLPLIIGIWIYYWPILKKAIRLITLIVVLFTIYGSIMMSVALHVKAWSYSSEKFLGIYFLGAVIEDIIWWIMILIVEVSSVVVLLKKQNNKEPLLKRS
ncbi:MAG: hypothetical protein ABH816_00300 [Candidatus Levyibacteriota bacterium]